MKNINEKINSYLNQKVDEHTKKRIASIVKYHGEIHIILDPKNNKIDEQFNKFKAERHDIFMALILLAVADTLGYQLKDNNPDEFTFRIGFYKCIINN